MPNNKHTSLTTFNGLSEQELNSLFNVANIKPLQPGDFLIKEGDTDQTLYILLDGEIAIVKDRDGEQVEIAVLGEGDWIVGRPIRPWLHPLF